DPPSRTTHSARRASSRGDRGRLRASLVEPCFFALCSGSFALSCGLTMPVLVYFILLWDKLTGRRPLGRSAEEQARADAATRSLALYHFRACPYCIKVRRDIRLLGLRIEERDIKKEQA